MESRMMVPMPLFAAMEKETEENRLMDLGGGRESEMYGESNMETHNMVCKIDSQWEFAL